MRGTDHSSLRLPAAFLPRYHGYASFSPARPFIGRVMYGLIIDEDGRTWDAWLAALLDGPGGPDDKCTNCLAFDRCVISRTGMQASFLKRVTMFAGV